jgi:hypothetical protein
MASLVETRSGIAVCRWGVESAREAEYPPDVDVQDSDIESN